MASNEQIINEAKTFINNDLNVSETSTQLRISKRTFQLHMKALEVIDKGLYKLVQEKTERLQVEGRLKGGSKGKRKPIWTKEKALEIADVVISHELTFEEAEKRFGIPKSTIYEMLNSDYIDADRKNQLKNVVLANIKKKNLALIMEENREHDRNRYL